MIYPTNFHSTSPGGVPSYSLHHRKTSLQEESRYNEGIIHNGHCPMSANFLCRWLEFYSLSTPFLDLLDVETIPRHVPGSLVCLQKHSPRSITTPPRTRLPCDLQLHDLALFKPYYLQIRWLSTTTIILVSYSRYIQFYLSNPFINTYSQLPRMFTSFPSHVCKASHLNPTQTSYPLSE
jgi:hypothetical protein